MWSLSCILVFAVAVIAVVSQPVSASKGSFNAELWTQLTQQYIHPGVLAGVPDNVVDYPGIAADPRLDTVLRSLATAAAPTTKNETYALFINAYNVLAIDMMVRHPCHSVNGSCMPYGGIWDIGNATTTVWDMWAGTVAGRNYTLDDVEDYLRKPTPYKEDPRLHACIVCASISCPNVLREAFVAERIEEQMTAQMQAFLANPKKGSLLDKSTMTLTLSPIFKWFAADFVAYSGSVPKFVAAFLPQAEASFVLQHEDSLTLAFFTYDWNR